MDSATSADLSMKRFGFGASDSLCEKALKESPIGGIESLCTFKKGDVTVCVIGCIPPKFSDYHESEEPLAAGQELAKLLVLPQLDAWSHYKEPVAFIVGSSLSSEHLENSSFEKARSVGCVSQKCCSLAFVIRIIALRCRDRDFTYNNLNFLSSPYDCLIGFARQALHSLDGPDSQALLRNSGIFKNKKVLLDFEELIGAPLSFQTIERHLFSVPKACHAFFSKGGPFDH